MKKTLFGAFSLLLFAMPALAHPGLHSHDDLAAGEPHAYSFWDYGFAGLALAVAVYFATQKRFAPALAGVAVALLILAI